MVRGLDRFKAHFQGLDENYVLIGGTACSLLMDDAGLDFRVTMDLDIVLCLEALDVDFVKAFWEFVYLGEYSNKQKSTGEKRFYRFHSPKDLSYPKMLELFSRVPDALHYEGEGQLTPIPVEEEVSSLSAILLNESYYEFLHEGKRDMDGIPVIGPEWIIPLKARAWLDLTKRKANGEPVDSKDIKKHRNDIFRLYRLIVPDSLVPVPDTIGEDLFTFFEVMENEVIDLKPLGYRKEELPVILAGMKKIFGLNSRSSQLES
jgi:hypothetical protein